MIHSIAGGVVGGAMIPLPDEVFTEMILCRLPIKSIIECRCVCKLWRSLITNPNFIKSYTLFNSKTTKARTFMHQFLFSKYKREACPLLFDINNAEEEEEKGTIFRPMFLDLPGRSYRKRIVGSVNGLICFYESLKSVILVRYFILFNPSIGRFLSVPSPILIQPSPAQMILSGRPTAVRALGFDETTHDYKILYILSTDCFLYSLNSNSWTKLITPPTLLLNPHWYCYQSSVVFLNGRIHWLHSDEPFHRSSFKYIMVFNLKDETFGRISLPECLANSQVADYVGVSYTFTMTEYGESSLAVIRSSLYYGADVWVMKEYGSMGPWTKLATLLPHGCSEVLGFRNNDQILTSDTGWGRLVLHDLGNQQVKTLMDTRPLLSGVYKYVPSLALLDKENNYAHLSLTDEIAQVEQQEKKFQKLRPSKRARLLRSKSLKPLSTMGGGGLRRVIKARCNY